MADRIDLETDRDTETARDRYVAVLVKGREKYVFVYDVAHRGEALRTLGRFAVDPGLSFTWYDAAVLSQRIRTGPGGAGDKP